jgi:hypothetical protein
MASDYRHVRTFKSREEAEKYKGASVSKRWWEETGDELANAVMMTGTALYDKSSTRRMTDVKWARLYENTELDSLSGTDFSTALLRQAVLGGGNCSYNVVAMAIDTLAAKIAKNRPRPTFITSGGNWDQQIKARRLDKWMKGVLYETKAYVKSPQVFIDGCEFGTGFLYLYRAEDKRLECERVLPSEIFVDDADGRYAKPQQMLRRKVVSRDVLCAMFPEHTEAIVTCGKDESKNFNATIEVEANQLEVWEAWHLPSSKKSKDGKHVISINNCVLFEEQWKLDKFPFVVFRYKKRTTGFWGKGVTESVAGIQMELNRLVRSVSEQLRRKGRGRVFVQMGSKINPANFTNGIGDIIPYVGQAPIVDNGNAVAPEEFNQIAALKQAALQEIGLSEMSAAAKKPSGLDAAVALREYSDIESERFALVHQAWEQFFMEFAELAIDLISTQYNAKGYEVKVPGRRSVTMIDWAEIDLDRDSYVMQIFPTSSLPQTPAARYAKVKEMLQDGFIQPPVAKRLLEFPDIEAETNLENAIIDDADATISAILDAENPEVQPLEPYQNLDMIISRANAAYLYARHNGCDENRLSLLRVLIGNATAKKVQLTAPPPPPAPPGGPMPGMPAGAPAPGPAGAQVGGDINVNAAAPIQPMTPPVVGM